MNIKPNEQTPQDPFQINTNVKTETEKEQIIKLEFESENIQTAPLPELLHKCTPFIAKLYSLVNNPSYQQLIHWSEEHENKAFIITDSVEFSKLVLPFHFKHSNISSFVRQLNIYGFHKIESKIGICFKHEEFIKDQPDLLSNIKRKKNKKPTTHPTDLSDLPSLIPNTNNSTLSASNIQNNHNSQNNQNQMNRQQEMYGSSLFLFPSPNPMIPNAQNVRMKETQSNLVNNGVVSHQGNSISEQMIEHKNTPPTEQELCELFSIKMGMTSLEKDLLDIKHDIQSSMVKWSGLKNRLEQMETMIHMIYPSFQNLSHQLSMQQQINNSVANQFLNLKKFPWGGLGKESEKR